MFNIQYISKIETKMYKFCKISQEFKIFFEKNITTFDKEKYQIRLVKKIYLKQIKKKLKQRNKIGNRII